MKVIATNGLTDAAYFNAIYKEASELRIVYNYIGAMPQEEKAVTASGKTAYKG